MIIKCNNGINYIVKKRMESKITPELVALAIQREYGIKNCIKFEIINYEKRNR